MRPDSEILKAGYEALKTSLDIVELARFISIINRENFDYTEWQRNLWTDKSVKEISEMAMREYKHPK